MCISQTSIFVAVTLRDGNLKCSTKQISDNAAMSLDGPNPSDGVAGITRRLCPGTSDVDSLGDLKRVVDLNAEIAYGVLIPQH
jgi:hypothetical protein